MRESFDGRHEVFGSRSYLWKSKRARAEVPRRSLVGKRLMGRWICDGIVGRLGACGFAVPSELFWLLSFDEGMKSDKMPERKRYTEATRQDQPQGCPFRQVVAGGNL